MSVLIALQRVCENTPLAYCITLMSPIARILSKNNCDIIIFSILWVYIISICAIALGDQKKNEKGNLSKWTEKWAWSFNSTCELFKCARAGSLELTRLRGKYIFHKNIQNYWEFAHLKEVSTYTHKPYSTTKHFSQSLSQQQTV